MGAGRTFSTDSICRTGLLGFPPLEVHSDAGIHLDPSRSLISPSATLSTSPGSIRPPPHPPNPHPKAPEVLLRKAEPTRVEAGEITAAFRRWKRPTVAAGGTLTTAIGVLGIEAVDRIDEAGTTEADASRAGFPGVEPLLAELRKRSTGEHFRITFQLKGPDPRTELPGAGRAGRGRGGASSGPGWTGSMGPAGSDHGRGPPWRP